MIEYLIKDKFTDFTMSIFGGENEPIKDVFYRFLPNRKFSTINILAKRDTKGNGVWVPINQ